MTRPQRRKLLKPHTLVVVKWLDANFDLDHQQECLPMLTVGWVTKHTREVICVASEVAEKMDYMRAHTSIPSGMILSIQEIEP